VARLLTGNPQATAEDGVRWTAEICRRLEIPPLRTYGVGQEDLAALVEKAAKASSMKTNPIILMPAELGEIMARAV
jgi:alcohol dehydrogenase class IV